MAWFSKKAAPASMVRISSSWCQWPTIAWGGRQNVVGEAHYQDALEAAGQGRSEHGTLVTWVTAQLVAEPTNPHDPQAIRVLLDGATVGYIPRTETKRFHVRLAELAREQRPFTCRAMLTGGWDRGPLDRGHIGIVLHVHDKLIAPPPDLWFLPEGGKVTITKPDIEVLGRYATPSRFMAGQLAEAPSGALGLYLDGQLAGELTPAMSERHLPLVSIAYGAGLPTTCKTIIDIATKTGKPRARIELSEAHR